jgi:peptidoglycan/xylan/chitin deacetylase (PgdA/CDA1 family)
MLDDLERRDVRATFFLQGRWVKAYPDAARRVAAGGYLVGNHSFYHARMTLLSAKGFDTDVRDAEGVIRDTLGVDPRPWFRLPFGNGFDRPALHRRLAALGYEHVHWHVSPAEWEPTATERQVEDDVVTGVLARGDGAVVLLHTWPRAGLAALPGIVGRLREAGAEFVRLDALEAWPSGEE